jgi:2'-5' RNA ligase
MKRVRTFIAVDLGKAIRDRAAALQEKLGRTGVEVKWVEQDNLHVTLLFLGEVDDRQVAEVCRIVGDRTAQRGAFPMSIEGVGSFPNPRRPRIIWIGVGTGASELCDLHDDLERPLTKLGYRREERKYTPHITIGRVRSEAPADALSAQLAKNGGWKGGETLVNEVCVMGSELTPQGPVYTVLSRAPLMGAES